MGKPRGLGGDKEQTARQVEGRGHALTLFLRLQYGVQNLENEG